MYIFLVISRNLHINYISLYFFNRNFRQAVQVHAQKKDIELSMSLVRSQGLAFQRLLTFVQSRAADVASRQGLPCACSSSASSSSPRTKKRHRVIDVFGAVTRTCISAIADFCPIACSGCRIQTRFTLCLQLLCKQFKSTYKKKRHRVIDVFGAVTGT